MLCEAFTHQYELNYEISYFLEILHYIISTIFVVWAFFFTHIFICCDVTRRGIIGNASTPCNSDDITFSAKMNIRITIFIRYPWKNSANGWLPSSCPRLARSTLHYLYSTDFSYPLLPSASLTCLIISHTRKLHFLGPPPIGFLIRFTAIRRGNQPILPISLTRMIFKFKNFLKVADQRHVYHIGDAGRLVLLK